jgi:endonuclease YncB( thermonuclease family)
VVSVLDGDTIEVLHNHHAERIRLNGIDCPEKGQAFGKRAKRAASALVFGKHITLHTYGKDK